MLATLMSVLVEALDVDFRRATMLLEGEMLSQLISSELVKEKMAQQD